MKNKIEIIKNAYLSPIDIEKQKDFDSVIQNYKLLKSKSLSWRNSIVWFTLALISFCVSVPLILNNGDQQTNKQDESKVSKSLQLSSNGYTSGQLKSTSNLANPDSLQAENFEFPEMSKRQNITDKLIKSESKTIGEQKIDKVRIVLPEVLPPEIGVNIEMAPDSSEKDNVTPPKTILEEPYPKDGLENLYAWFEQNITYPEEHKKDAIEGYVKVSFQVNKDSTIGEIQVIKSLGMAFDQEAVRLIEQMPQWIPAKRNGIPFSKTLILPVGFRIESR